MPGNGYALLIVRSVTNAMRGQKILETHGVGSYVQRNTNNQGCGYALKINCDPVWAANLLRSAGIQVSEIVGGVSG